MGITIGHRGMCPPGLKFWVDISQEIMIFKEDFLNICKNFQISQYFQNRVVKIQGEIRFFGVGAFDSTESVP